MPTLDATAGIPPPIQYYLLCFCRSLHRYDGLGQAEDLYQDVMYRFYKNGDSYVEQGNMKAYLATIARNRYMDWLRERKNRQRLTATQPTAAAARNDGEQRLRIEEITRQIELLEPMYRTPFEMHVLEGLKYEEIAERLAAPIGTIKSRIFLARKRLVNVLTARERGSARTKYLIRELKAH